MYKHILSAIRLHVDMFYMFVVSTKFHRQLYIYIKPTKRCLYICRLGNGSKRILDYMYIHNYVHQVLPPSCHRSSVIIVTLHQEVACMYMYSHTELVRWFQPAPLNHPLTANPRHVHALLNNTPSTRCVVWKCFYRMFTQKSTL